MQLKRLEISNFKSYGENQIIEFEKNTTYLLIGNNLDAEGMHSNESGKTSLIESILWILTGQPPKPSMNADDVIRRGQDKCEGKLTITTNNNNITIHRIRKTSGSELYFYINGKLQNPQIKVKSKVQPLINEYFGIQGTPAQILKDLKITNILTFNSVESFAKSSKDKERFNFISRVFNLDKWDKCKEATREKRKKVQKDIDSMNSKLEVYKDLIENTKLAQLTENIENLNYNLPILKNKIEKVRNEYSELEQKEEQLKEIKKAKQKKEKLINKVANVKSEISSTKSDYNKSIENLNNEIKKLKDLISHSSIKEIKKELDIKKEKHLNIQSNIKEHQQKIKVHSKKLKHLEKRLHKSSKCPNCKSDLMIINNNIKLLDKNKIKDKIKNRESVKSDLDNKINQYEKRSKSLKEEIINLNKELEFIKSINNKKEKIKNRKKHHTNLIKEKKKYLQTLKESLESLSSDSINDLEINQAYIDNKKPQLEKEANRLEKEINKSVSLKGEYKNKIKEYKKSENKCKSYKKELDKKEKTMNGLNFWYDSFPEIKRMIIQSTIPNIENLTNKYLSSMQVPLEVKLSTLKETKTTGNKKQAFNIKIYDKIENRLTDFYNRSMGGRKRIGIALCFALQEIKFNNLNNWFNFKVLDELLENLDEAGQDTIYSIIGQTKGQCIITSHNNQLKDKFRNIISVSKSNGISRIVNAEH